MQQTIVCVVTGSVLSKIGFVSGHVYFLYDTNDEDLGCAVSQDK